jgi:hypothetical protein
LIVASVINFGVIFCQLDAAPPESKKHEHRCAHALFAVFVCVGRSAIGLSTLHQQNYFFSGMLNHYSGLHFSQSADAGTSE